MCLSTLVCLSCSGSEVSLIKGFIRYTRRMLKHCGANLRGFLVQSFLSHLNGGLYCFCSLLQSCSEWMFGGKPPRRYVAKKKEKKKLEYHKFPKKACLLFSGLSSQGSPSHSAGLVLILTQWPTAFGTLVPPFGPCTMCM